MSDLKKSAFDPKGSMASDGAIRIRYDSYFRLFGMIPQNVDQYLADASGTKRRGAGLMSRLYCRLVSLMLWLFFLRTIVLTFVWDRETQVMMGDLTGYWTDDRPCYLVPMAFFSLHAALIMSKWHSKAKELAWLVPYLSPRHMDGSNPGTIDYPVAKKPIRTFVGIVFCIFVVSYVTSGVAVVYYTTARQNLDDHTFRMWLPWLVANVLWFFYMSGITFFTSMYFNMVTSQMGYRFELVARDIDELAERENGAPGSKNNSLMNLYAEHNEACELVDEANTFWEAFVFYAYAGYIPCACYALYNVFFARFDDLLGPVTWGTFWYCILGIIFVSMSAATVSTQAHAPYTALHTLSLLQMPVDLEVNMSTFLHRVRGPTIGISCMDLFVITSSSISTTLAAVVSYFLIVADFSRSTVVARMARKAREQIEMSMAEAGRVNGSKALVRIGESQ